MAKLNLTAKIKTKSNYMNLNGEKVKILSFHGTIVHCEYFCPIRKTEIQSDFSLKEITEIREIN
jgi:hypothetical protein